MSDILEAAHREACKNQMFLAFWKRHLILLIKSTAPFSTESTGSTKSLVLEQSTTGETPGFLTHRHFPELPMCSKLSVTLAMNNEYALHTLIVDFFHSHSFFFNFCVTMHYLWQEVSLSAFFNGWIQLHLFLLVSKGFLSRKIDHDIQCTTLRPLPSIYKDELKSLGCKLKEQIIRHWNSKHQAPRILFRYFGHIFADLHEI